AGNHVGRITPAGVIKEFPVPTASSQPLGITAGPDGNIWFTEAAGSKVGRLTIPSAYALVLPSGFAARSVSAGRGVVMRWMFVAPGSHDVTDASGMGLFGSGSRLPVSYYSFA